MGGAFLLLLPLLCLWSCSSFVSATHNITEILARDAEFSVFSRKLVETNLTEEINSRKTITVLALSNANMNSLPNVTKDQLAFHVLLDYYSLPVLHSLPNGTANSTSLYQTTGKGDGVVNITVRNGQNVSFKSGNNPPASLLKSVQEIRFDIAVLEISTLIDGGIKASPPAPSPSPAVTPSSAPAPASSSKNASPPTSHSPPAPAPLTTNAPEGLTPAANTADSAALSKPFMAAAVVAASVILSSFMS